MATNDMSGAQTQAWGRRWAGVGDPPPWTRVRVRPHVSETATDTDRGAQVELDAGLHELQRTCLRLRGHPRGVVSPDVPGVPAPRAVAWQPPARPSRPASGPRS